ncbi:MAG: beta-lactamase family protein [Ktedonobacteraceae bacterium]|nr:beta-lactamase family protein [Ktedonobacteraceae bacterium]
MAKPTIQGRVEPGFENVREEFARNFTERGELGGACAMYHKGQKVVDLWGGYRDGRTRVPWTEDTMVIVFSLTKGIAGMTMAVAQGQGMFDYDAPVIQYWPEFAQAGKEDITVRQLLNHEAGLCVLDEPLNSTILANPDALAEILARQKPVWEPGSRHGYHAFTLGWYESELLRRTDPQRRTVGQFFQDELAWPLGLEFYIGLPPGIHEERIATVTEPGIVQKLLGMPRGMMLDILRPGSLTLRTANPRVRSNLVFNQPPYRNVEMPSVNGIGPARSIAQLYSVFATDGQELDIPEATLAALKAPAIPSGVGGWRDVILHTDVAYSLGFLKPCPGYRFGSSDAAFGAPGSGGSFGFADPDAQVGYAYVTNKQGAAIFDDPREKAVRDAFYSCLLTLRERETNAESDEDSTG